MSNLSAQNGRLPTATEQASPPTDPRLRNQAATDAQRICRDFIWGICLMGKHCRYRHELEFEAMKSVLRFCHDHQNRTGCTRPDCTYLHTSREEQVLFLTTGQIPRVLADRYAATAIPVGSATDSMLMPPPPPPPPVSTSSSMAVSVPIKSQVPSGSMTTMKGPMDATLNGAMSTVLAGPMTHMTGHNMAMNGPITTPLTTAMPSTIVAGHSQMHGAMPVQTNGVISSPMAPIIAPPPPPPPPPATSAATRPTPAPTPASVYPAPAPQLHQPAMYPQTPKQPSVVLPQLPLMFDPTRPPPPLPAPQVRAVKRPTTEAFNEGESFKLRKVDGGNDGVCENCLQTQLRIDFYQHEVEKLQREEEYQRAFYAKKTEDYENGIRLLNTLFNSDVIQLLGDNELHTGSSSATLNDYFTSPAPSTSYNNSDGTSTLSRNLLLQLMNAFASSYSLSPRTTKELSPPLEPRRPQPSQNNDALAILDWLKSALVESRAPAADLNGLSRFVEPVPGPSRYQPSFVESERTRYPASFTEERTPARYPATYTEPERPYPVAYVEPESLPGPSRYNPTSFAEPPPPAPPVVQPYVTFPQQVPQPSVRPYYTQPYHAPTTSPSHGAPMAYSNPGPSMQRSETSSQPSNGVYPQYNMTRLPQQYYPTYQ